MTARKSFDVFLRDADGSFSCAYGPFTLHTAFQPMLEPQSGTMCIAGYHGQIRIERTGDSYTPSEFFNTVDIKDMAAIDCQMAALHLQNAVIFAGSHASFHVARNPRYFHTLPDMREDAERLRQQAVAVGIEPRRVVCELQLRDYEDLQRATLFAGHLRRAGFQIGIDGYAGEEQDMARLREIRPSFVRFDTGWTSEFLKSSAGTALLRVIIRQFRDQSIKPVISGIEDELQVEILERIGVPRLQGHALAWPERAPATFEDRFAAAGEPAAPVERLRLRQVHPATTDATPEDYLPSRKAIRRNAPVFGRRGLA
nr:EAL domain-containing protein [uncultured Gellertiella sp.]